MASETLGLPTPFELALAVVIIANKPGDLSVRNHIASLRTHIHTRSNLQPYAEKAFIDSVELWKRRCERLEDEKSALIAEYSQLRSRNEGQTTDAPRRSGRKSNKTRQAACETDEPAARSAKRARLDGHESFTRESVTLNAARDEIADNVLSTTACGMRLADTLYHIHCQLDKPASPDDTSLAYHITTACSSISAIVQLFDGDAEKIDVAELVLALGRSFRVLLYAATKLKTVNDEGSQKARAATIFAIVSTVEVLLQAISACSLRRALLEKRKTAGQATQKTASLQYETKTSKLLTNLLLACCDTDALDPSCGLHREVFEGFAYLVLQHAGVHLATMMFGSPAGDFEVKAATKKQTTEEAEQAAIKYDAIHLGQLIDRMIILSSSYLSPPDGPKLSRSKPFKADGPAACAPEKWAPTALHPIIRNKLQRTLIESMFPTTSGDGDEFMERLRMPPKVFLKEPKRVTATEKERMSKDTEGWFLEKMWCAVGWEMLRHDAN